RRPGDARRAGRVRTRYATARTSKPLLHPAAERGGVLGFDPDVLLRKRPQRVTVRLLLGEPRQRGGAVQLGRHQRQVRALEGGAAEGPERLLCWGGHTGLALGVTGAGFLKPGD